MQSETVYASRAVNATGLSIAISVLLVILGMTAMLVSIQIMVAIGILILWVIVFAGLGHLIHAWDARETRLFAWRLLVGLVYVASGIFLLVHPRYDRPFFTLFIAWMFGLESTLLLGAYSWLRKLPGAGWIAIDGAVTLFLAILIGALWQWLPLWTVGILVGISIASTGITSFALAWSRRDLFGSVPT
ncbi:MAG TPA: DUF308 domain-containing protein [Gammaproteobacteria bacterium]|nr:DUF308 domain-containing protein [Gammaproteobacteria bacterium]